MIVIKNFMIEDYNKVAAFWGSIENICNCNVCTTLNTRERLAKFLARNPGLSFVAVSEGEIVGTVLAGHDGRTGLIYRLAVSEEHRKQGIATALVQNAVDALKREGMTVIKVFVLNGNDDGNAFWEKAGFRDLERAVTREYVVES